MNTLASAERRSARSRRWVWAFATLTLGLSALVSPSAAAAAASDSPAQIIEPITGPWAPGGPIDEPKSRWREPIPPGPDTLVFPYFTGREFNLLFSTAELPNLSPISDPPTITDSEEMDSQIRTHAETRGYQRRPLPQNYSLLRLIDDGLALQPSAAEAWLALQAEAAAHGFELRLTSAYRGHRYQREVFLRPLTTPPEFVHYAERLKMSAPPGYSKHHTGYAVDIGQSGYGVFRRSPAYDWLSADNFTNAKKHGWIPSYPADGGRQGPVPEAWEFTYVGVGAILCFHQPPAGDDPLCNH